MGAFCNPSNHSKNKKNCEFNPNCLYGFVNNKSGIWGPTSTLFHSLLGPDPDAEKRDPDTPCGLVNLGATCYVNSLLQVLFFDGIFREALYSWKPRQNSLNLGEEWTVSMHTRSYTFAARNN